MAPEWILIFGSQQCRKHGCAHTVVTGPLHMYAYMYTCRCTLTLTPYVLNEKIFTYPTVNDRKNYARVVVVTDKQLRAHRCHYSKTTTRA